MGESLAAKPSLDAETRWAAMRELLERVFGVLDRDAALDESLDIIVELLGADRGQIVLVDVDGVTRTVHARGRGRSIDPAEHEEISKTIIRRAFDTGECATWDSASLPSTASVGALGILAALAAPLHRPGQAGRKAVLYVDIRDPRKHLDASHVDFFMSAALLVGALLDQRERGEAVRARLGEALAHTTDTRKTPTLDDLLGFESLRAIREEVASALGSDAPILILGESGTGKTLLAQSIAEASGRRPIVRATLGGSDDLNTITSELFGHERGAFSGAAGRRVGLVEFANNGTLVLDELLNLPPHAQKLLLDFTQFGTYPHLGYGRAEPKEAKLRIIAATNGNLRAAMKDGRFREDLYHRLAAVVLAMPPLRARREDVPVIAERTLRRADAARAWTLSAGTRRLLASPALEWSGNVRQLERVILRARERAVLRDPEATEIVPEHFEARDLDGVAPSEAASGSASAAPAASEPIATRWQKLQGDRATLDEAEDAMIRQALADAGGVVAAAARALGIARTTLASRLEVLGIRAKKGE
jgi:transcriptional regulator with GAF, ATPase, and Fis domain